MVKYIQGTL